MESGPFLLLTGAAAGLVNLHILTWMQLSCRVVGAARTGKALVCTARVRPNPVHE
jgi:hypothetical protein